MCGCDNATNKVCGYHEAQWRWRAEFLSLSLEIPGEEPCDCDKCEPD